jgi:hypothetical protein
MKKIALNDKLNVLIDDEDYDLVKDYPWAASASGNKFYARTFLKIDGNNSKFKSLFLQHLIIGKAPKGMRLSFKDGDSLNCQKHNLEFITWGQAAHKYYKKNKISKNAEENFRGVIVQYIARIKHNNKIIVLGNFSNEKDAAKAYNLKAMELYGESAVVNRI